MTPGVLGVTVILDRFSHHAGVCVAGGERVHRHYAVRDLLFSWAEKAGLHSEKERPGLLLPQTPEDVQSGRRRPADVFLPALAGGPAALELRRHGASATGYPCLGQ